jgi:hypothetical protein
MVWPLNCEASQQIWIRLVALCLCAGPWALINRHQAHQTHQPANALLIDQMTLGAQVPRHLANTIEWRVEELLIYQAHQRQVQCRFPLEGVIEGRSRD